MKHKKQHFIPCSYLEAWCDPATPPGQEPYIWMMPKNGGPGYRRAPQNAFHETDMYTIKLPDGSRNLVIEHGLAGLENLFAELRRGKLSIFSELSLDDRAILCAFTAAMHARTPKNRFHIGDIFCRIKNRMKEMRDKIDKAKPQERAKIINALSNVSSGGPTFSFEETAKMADAPLQHTLIPSVMSETPLLLRADLAILFTDDFPGFITSDAPCIWFDPESHSRPFPHNTPGLAWPSIEITMPISPTQILFLNRAGITGYIQIDDNNLDSLNRRTRIYSDKYFVVSSNQTKPTWFETSSPSKP